MLLNGRRAQAERGPFARAAAEIDGAGALHFEPFDLSDVAAIPAFVHDLKERRGPIYGLVNNAGVGTGGLLANMANADIEALLRLNTLAPIVLTKYVVRGMMAEDGAGRQHRFDRRRDRLQRPVGLFGRARRLWSVSPAPLARRGRQVGVTVNALRRDSSTPN